MSNWVRKYQALYIAGAQRVGSLTEYTAPVLEVITEDFRGGGMDMATPMDMGMAPMAASFTISEDPVVLGMFGLKVVNQMVPLFIRAHLEDEESGETKQVIETLRGIITKIDPGTKSAGAHQATTVEMKLSYYANLVGKVLIHEIDPKNMVRRINGIDQLSLARASLGM